MGSLNFIRIHVQPGHCCIAGKAWVQTQTLPKCRAMLTWGIQTLGDVSGPTCPCTSTEVLQHTSMEVGYCTLFYNMSEQK